MFFRPGVLARYLRLILTGWRPRRGEAGEDMLQLGGDFILSADGTFFTPTGATTRPTDPRRPTS